MNAFVLRIAVDLVTVLGLVLTSGCAGPSPAPSVSDRNLELVHEFVSAWLVDRDLKEARSFLSASFFVLEGPHHENTIEQLGPAAADPALEFAISCSSGCSTSDSCFFNLDAHSTSVWSRERLRVGDSETAADSRLAKFLGQDLEVFSSRLLGCGHVVSLGVQSAQSHPPTEARIAFIYLVAP